MADTRARKRALSIATGMGVIAVEGVSFRMPRPNGYAVRIVNDVEAPTSPIWICGSDHFNIGIRIDPEVGPTYLKNLDIDFDGGGNAIRLTHGGQGL